MKRLWLAGPAGMSGVVFVLALMTWTLPPIDLVRPDGRSGSAYVGTAFGQLVVDFHTGDRRAGERFGRDQGIAWAGIRVVRCQSLERDNRVVACRVPLLWAAGLALPLPAA